VIAGDFNALAAHWCSTATRSRAGIDHIAVRGADPVAIASGPTSDASETGMLLSDHPRSS
jgi:hypothetical protein